MCRFDSLTICERVNALTCTSAFLTEILIQMYRNDTKKGIPGYFSMNHKKLSFQNYILEPSYSKHIKDQQDAEMQTFKLNQQFYLGTTGLQTKYNKYSDSTGFSFNEMDQSRHDQYRLHPQFFEDLFVMRQRHITEQQQLKMNDPFKYFSQ